MDTFLYFAYGSNMSERRLRKRVPSAKVVGTGILKNHCLTFQKKVWTDPANAPSNVASQTKFMGSYSKSIETKNVV